MADILRIYNKEAGKWEIVPAMKGADGVSLGQIALVQTEGQSTEAVMSQKAVTDLINQLRAEIAELKK